MKVDEFVEAFFGSGNELSLEEIRQGPHQEHARWLEVWIDRLAEGEWTVLPRRIGSKVTWYGIAPSEQSLDRLSLKLKAWVGPGFTDFDGRPPRESEDPWERKIESLTAENWLRLRVVPGQIDEIRPALSLLRQLEDDRPKRIVQDTTPTGRLIRDFDWALRAKDAEKSRDILDSLATSGRINAMNLNYLRVQRLSALERWEALIEMPGLFDVVASRRPRAVTRALLRGLYEVHIAGSAAEDFEVALDTFEESVAGKFNALFESLPSSPELWELRLYALWATVSPPKPVLAAEIVGLLERRGWSDLLIATALASIDTGDDRVGPLEAAQQAINDFAFHSAFEELRAFEDGARHAALSVQCAVELDTPEAIKFARDALANLDSRDRSFLTESKIMSSLIERVESRSSHPSNWTDLVRGINQGNLTLNDIDWIREDVVHWDSERAFYDLDALTDRIVADRGDAEDLVLRSVLPGLVAAIESRGDGDDPRFRAVLAAVADVLSLADTRSSQERDVMLDLCETLIDGADRSQYTELVERIIYVIGEDDSPYLVSWVLESLEVFAGYPVGDVDSRDQLAALAVDFLVRRRDRLSSEDRVVATSVFEEFGYDFDQLVPDGPEEPPPPVSWPAGISIGIYTLTPGVGQRVANAVGERQSNIKVRLNSDHVATNELKAMARESDIVVLVNRSATHAASDAIRSERPEGSPILYPSGKGSSSIISALHEFLVGDPRSLAIG